MDLNTQQRAVLDAVLAGRSVFYTGCAGTGKSFLLRAIVRALPRRTTWVTAMTGVAALQIGGSTLHSRAGIGLARRAADDLVRFMKRQTRAAWRDCVVLIIDEVSMLSRALFEKLDAIGRAVRSDARPFGGIQLVLCGDFHQLPPVGAGADGEFCFESPMWDAAVPHRYELTEVFRQRDAAFVALLAEVRSGVLSPDAVARLAALDRPLPDGAVEPTRLFPTNGRVDDLNERALGRLDGETCVYNALDYARTEEARALLGACIAPPSLALKVGAQVMLVRNLDETHVNGSRGVVVRFHPTSSMPVVRFLRGDELMMEPQVWEVEGDDGAVVASRTQVPLRLAWAVTIHKSQGLTIDWLDVDLEGTFACGQAYVALSRARSLEGLRVRGFHPACVRTHPSVRALG